MQAVQLVGCGVIGAALAVLLVSVCCWLAVRVGGVIERAGPSLIRTDPAGDSVQRAGSRASSGKMGKRKRPGQTARRALLLWPLVCTGGNGSGGVRPGAGGWRYTRAFCPLYPGRPGCTGSGCNGSGWWCSIRAVFGRLPEGSDSPPNGIERQV